jgi:ATP-dependent Clp protease adaptor protein ClpS
MQSSMSEVVIPVRKRRVRSQRRTRVITIPRYHVVLMDDNDHTYDYVIEMLTKLFGHSRERAFLLACEVDGAGRVIVDTTTKERAELKRDQIHAYGPDWRIPRCKGSMSAVIEPAPGQDAC